MEDTKIETIDSPNDEPISEDIIADEPAEGDAPEADTTVSREEHDKLKREKDELYIQLKKAKAAKGQGNQSKAEAKGAGDRPINDILALVDVHEDDRDEVLEWAEFKGVSVPEAKRQLKVVLAGKVEERKTAQATSTGAARRSTSKVSDESLLERATNGDLPEGSDMERTIKARMEKLRNKA